MNFNKIALIACFTGLCFLSSCSFLDKATNGGKKSLVDSPISVKDNLNSLTEFVRTIDVGFDTLKYISSSTITGLYIHDFSIWKSTNPLVKLEFLPKNNKSLVKIDINNYPAYPSNAYITENKITYEDDKKTSQSIVTIIPQKNYNWLLLVWNILITVSALIAVIFIIRTKK